MRLRTLSFLWIVVLLAACGSHTPPQPTPSSVARIVVTPTSLLLTHAGDTQQLVAQAFDDRGNPVEATLTWTSSDPSAVRVSEDGTVTSLAALGSSQITVQAQGVTSAAVFALAATPVANAVLVADAQILEGPTVLNPDLGSIVGTRTTVLLADTTALATGTILLARESASLAGRIVSVTSEGTAQRVEVETVPLTELFDAFDFDQTFELREENIDVASLPSDIQIDTDADGQLLITYVPDPSLSLQASRFECTGAAAPYVKMQGFSLGFKLELKATMTGKKSAGGETEEMSLLVEGEASAVAKGGLMFEAGLKGEMACTLALYDALIPMSGALSALIAPGLKLVGEVKVDGTIKAVTVEATVAGSVGVKLKSGFVYRAKASAAGPAGYTPIFSAEPVASFTPTYKAPSVYDARVDVGLFVGPALQLQARALTLGNQSLLDVSLAEGRLGLRGDLSLAHYKPQGKDAAYASAYDLKIRGEVGVGDGLQRVIAALGLVGVGHEDIKITFDSPPLASSPTGTLSLSHTQAMPGDEVTFDIALDSVTFPFIGDNVNAVQLYYFKENGPASLADPTFFASIAPNASNQTSYTHTWTVPRDWSGEYKFVAFTDTVLAPGLPLEVTANSVQTLVVGGVCAPFPTGSEFPSPPPPPPGQNPGETPIPPMPGEWCDWQGTASVETHNPMMPTWGDWFIQVRWEMVPAVPNQEGVVYQVHSGSIDWRLDETDSETGCRMFGQESYTLGEDNARGDLWGDLWLLTENEPPIYEGGGGANLDVTVNLECPEGSSQIPMPLGVTWFETSGSPLEEDGKIIEGDANDAITTVSWRFERP